jgi:S1-C subfamily serine protease/tetratricopeptide (TPR) repeat protein
MEMTMAHRWYVRRDDNIRGPFSTRELRALVANSEANASDYFREGDSGPWTSGKRVRGLFGRPVSSESASVDEEARKAEEEADPALADIPHAPERGWLRRAGYVLGACAMLGLLVLAWRYREGSSAVDEPQADLVMNPAQPPLADAHLKELQDLRRQLKALEQEVQRKAAKPVPIDQPTDAIAADTNPDLVPLSSEQFPTPSGLPALIKKIEPGVVSLECARPQGGSRGAGFVLEKEKIVVTNLHMIAGASDAMVILRDGKRLPVLGIWAASTDTDLALLAVDLPGDNSQGLSMAAGECSKGERVLTLGSPSGLTSSATEGIVSAVRSGREIISALGFDEEYHARGLKDGTIWIQTSAPISPGNSGGPLLNEAGEVVGINTWSHPAGNDINFAVAADHVRELLEHLPAQALPLAQFPALPENLPAPQAPPVDVENPVVAQQRLAQLRSIYEQRLVLLARRETLDYKILEVRSKIESVQADQTNLAQQAADLVARATLTEEDLASLSNQKSFSRDPIEAQTYDLAIEQRRTELRALAGAASALQAQATANHQLLGDLAQQMADAEQAQQRLWNEQRSLRSEFLNLADPFGKLARGDHEAGIIALSEWIALDTSNPDAYFARGLAYAHLGQAAEALQDFDRAAEFADAQSAELLAARGWLQVRSGDAKAGENELRQALGVDRMSGMVYLFRGMAALESDREGVAIKEFRDAVRVEPGSVEGHRQLAWVLATAQNEKLRKGKQALAAAQRACALTKSKDAACLQTLAAAHAAAGEFTEALRRIDEAIALSGDAAELALQKEAYEQKLPWVRAEN